MENENLNPETEQVENPEAGAGSAPDANKSIEEQLAELLAENKRLRRANDKASSEAADYKRQLNARMSESERQEQERAEAAEAMANELKELRRERDLNKLMKNFTVLGYSEDMAKEAAEAQYEGDTDKMFDVQRKYKTELENKIKSEFMRGTPPPQSGSLQGGTPLTEAQIKSMTPAEINAAWKDGRIQNFLSQKGK